MGKEEDLQKKSEEFQREMREFFTKGRDEVEQRQKKEKNTQIGREVQEADDRRRQEVDDMKWSTETDHQGHPITHEEHFHRLLLQFNRDSVNTTSDWRHTVSELTKLNYALAESLRADFYNVKLRGEDYLNEKISEHAKDYPKLALASTILLNPIDTTKFGLYRLTGEYGGLKGVVYDMFKEDLNNPLPKLKYFVNYKEGKLAIDDLTTDPTQNNLGTTINETFKKGVELWLQENGCEVGPDKQIYKIENGGKRLITEDEFIQMKEDKDKGLAAFLEMQVPNNTFEESSGPRP